MKRFFANSKHCVTTFCLLVILPAQVMGQGAEPGNFGSAASGGAPLLLEQPQTARDLVNIRAHYDQTVWSKEVMAQEFEQAFVDLWDRLLQNDDKYEVFRTSVFDRMIGGTEPRSQQLDWGIQVTKYAGQPRELSFAEWVQELNRFEKAGYRIVETEWHHLRFDPPTETAPANSTVSMLMHVENSAQQQRFVIKGDMQVEWRRGANDGTAVPSVIDVRGLAITRRTGAPAFVEKRVEQFATNSQGVDFPSTIHPVILQDLNGDHLPELVIAGYNKVYWNKGKWEFEVAELCEFPPEHTNAALFADLTGDGVLDYLCVPKNGYPHLYQGSPGGKFSDLPQVMKFIGDPMPVPIAVTAGDIDHDGDLDLFIGQQRPGYQTGDIPTPYFDATDSFPSYLLVNDGQGSFHDATPDSGLGEKARRRNFSASFVDLDEDGDLDLVLTSDFSGTDIFTNDGQGHFTDRTDTLHPRGYAFGMSHTFGDYNLDGKLDFLTIGMSSTTARRLDHLQIGRDDFPEYNQARAQMGYGNRMYLQDATGFSQAAFNQSVARTGWSWGSTTFDFDNDSDPDLYIVNGQTSGKTTKDYCTRFWCHDLYYKKGEIPVKAVRELFTAFQPLFRGDSISWNGFEHNALEMNLGGKDFVNVAYLMGVASELDCRAALSGDLDGDGRVDLVFENADVRNERSRVFLFRNEWQSDNHWIGVHLDTNQATRPLGAVVRVHLSDGRELVQHNTTGHSVWAQHANTIHFGLGTSDRVESIQIRWANGKTSRMENPQVDQYHVANE
jgi:hypothetical protein